MNTRSKGRPRWSIILCAAVSLILFLLVYLLRLDRVVGMYVDDAWYVLLAKAIATGQGYTMINSPTPGILPPLYPPAFPFLLSLIFRLAPAFPQNLWLLKSISIVAMLGVGIAAYYYFNVTRALPASISFGLSLALIFSPLAVLLATTMVMSDAVFILSLLLIVIAIERCVVCHDSNAWSYAATAGALMAFAFLTRSISAGLALAVLGYLAQKRRWREGVIFGAICGLLIAPWLVYARLHAPAPELLQEQNGYIVQSYKNQFWQKKASVAMSGTQTIQDFPKRLIGNLGFVGRGALAETILSDSVYQLQVFGVWRIVVLQLLTLLLLLGYVAAIRRQITLAEIYLPIALGITIIWPFHEVRYLLPLLPFLLLYALEGLRFLLSQGQQFTRFSLRAQEQNVWQVAVWGLVVFCLATHVAYIRALRSPATERPIWTQKFEESERVMAWVGQHVPSDQIIATDNAPLLHLMTGHKTISSDELQSTSSTPVSSRPYWNKFKVQYAVGPWIPPFFLHYTKHQLVYRPTGSQYLRVAVLQPDEAPPAVQFVEVPEDNDR